MTAYKIALLDGDGIGPEIIAKTFKNRELDGKRNNNEFNLKHDMCGDHTHFYHGYLVR